MKLKNYRIQWLLENLIAIITIMTFVIVLSGFAKIVEIAAEFLTK